MPKNTPSRIIDSQRTRAASFLGGSGAAPGISDHGLLAGLIDNDHPQYALGTTTVTAGAGLIGGGALSAGALTLTVGTGNMITVTDDAVSLANGSGTYQFIGTGSGTTAGWHLVSELAGDGLTHTTALNVGVSGLGLSVGADAVTLTSSSNPGAAASILASDSAGALALTKLRTPLLDTAAGNMVLQPAGDLVLDPQGNDVFPQNNYDINLGALNLKYLSLHAAELWVETLVAQNTIATIGGRILVGPTTTLTRDLAAGATTIYVKHNQMVSGDRTYMEADGKVEFFAITSGATSTGTDYSYTVTRNLDGTGANTWYAGDAMFNTGSVGGGFIDIYSVRGVKSASEAGPTIVGNVRASTTYNDWAPRWAVGNLNGVFGYGANAYGLAAGDASGANVTVDATYGVRLRQSTTDMIVLDASGNSYFAGPMTIGTSGGIYQGSGSFSTPTTGLKLWRDSGIGRIAGYNAGTLQWGAGTDGKLTAGADNVQLSADGMRIKATAVSPDATARSILWAETLPNTDPTGEVYSWATTYNELAAVARNKSTTRGARGRFGSSVDGTLQAGMRTTSAYSGGWAHSVDVYGNTTFANNVSITGTTAFLGRVSTEAPLRQHTSDDAWSIDVAGGTPVVAANGAVFQFSDAGSFSGFVVVSNSADGGIGAFLCGGGVVAKMGDGSNVYSTTKDTASKSNLYYDSGSGEYRLQNNTGGSRTYSIFSVRTRAGS